MPSAVNITENSALFNKVCNTPAVRGMVSWLGGDIDIQPLVDQGGGFVLDNEKDGGFFLQRSGEGSYVIHTAFLPSTPIGLPYTFAKECLWVAFMALDVYQLYSSACDSNPAAKRLLRRSGFKEDFRSPSRFGGEREEGFYSLTIDEYIRNSEWCKHLGEEFHRLVEDTTNHGEDEVHDRYAGAAVGLVRSGNYQKAEEVYNRWAILAGYEALKVFEEDCLIKVGGMEIRMNGEMNMVEEVVCQ